MWEKILQNKKLLFIGLVIVLIIVGLVVWIILRETAEEKPSLPKEVERETPQVVPKPSALPGEVKPIPQEIARPAEETEEELITPLDELIGQTPFYSPNFSIRYLPEERALEVTLYAIYNRPEQYQWFIEQLKQYKPEALAWIEQFGVNPKELNIIYIPEEAKNL